MRRQFLKTAALLILVLAVLYAGLQTLESRVLLPVRNLPEQMGSKTVICDGIQYFPRQDITVLMVLGIDRPGPMVSGKGYRNPGAADTVMLLLFDEAEQSTTVLVLNRDTMLDMDVLGIRGEYAGTAYGQLALAYTYGSGMEDSCENVKNTLMKYLRGLTVDYYVAMTADALPILNDAVGGVTVTVTDDFSQVDPDISLGSVKLRGTQVIDYVKTRRNVGDQKNQSRMERQQEYVRGFLRALQEASRENADHILSAYEEAAPYMVTDCSAVTFKGMLDRYAGFALEAVVTPAGASIVADGHEQFYADEAELDALVMDLFYAPKR